MSLIVDNGPDQKEIEISEQHEDPMISMIERVIRDPNASIEKLEKMLDMKERLEDRAREASDREQKKSYYRAMASCQSELKVVAKNKENTHTKSSYADLAALSSSADPVIHKNGFTVSFQPAGIDGEGNQLIKWTIAHEDGHIESDTAALPVDKAGSQGKVNKTPLQAFGSTATYGRRYLKLMLFDIATGDDNDGNAQRNDELISNDQVNELVALAEKVGADIGKFCEIYEVECLADIHTGKFLMAKNALLQKALINKGKPDA